MSGSTLVTGPAVEPVTVEEAVSQCRITDTAEEGLVAGYLLAARELIEWKISRALITQSWTETFDHDWPRAGGRASGHHAGVGYYAGGWRASRRRIELPLAPVQGVTSVQYVDTTGATQTLDPSQYQLGKHKLIWILEEAFGMCWPAVRCQTDAISVTYVAGYASPGLVPETVRQAILLLVEHFYSNRGAVVVSPTRSTVIELPMGVEALLAKPNVPWVF